MPEEEKPQSVTKGKGWTRTIYFPRPSPKTQKPNDFTDRSKEMEKQKEKCNEKDINSK